MRPFSFGSRETDKFAPQRESHSLFSSLGHDYILDALFRNHGVNEPATHWPLESQTLPEGKIAQEVERLTREIARKCLRFWSDK